MDDDEATAAGRGGPPLIRHLPRCNGPPPPLLLRRRRGAAALILGLSSTSRTVVDATDHGMGESTHRGYGGGREENKDASRYLHGVDGVKLKTLWGRDERDVAQYSEPLHFLERTIERGMESRKHNFISCWLQRSRHM